MKAEDARNMAKRSHYVVKSIYRTIETAANKGDFTAYFGILNTDIVEILRNDGYTVTTNQNGNTWVEWK